MKNKPAKSQFPCPCYLCEVEDKNCIKRGAWQKCEDYRKWVNWSWARFRGWPRRMELKEEEERAKAKKVWRYVEPYLMKDGEI